MAKSISDYKAVLSDLKDGVVAPVYFLMGEESFFMDIISDYIEKSLLGEAEQTFDQEVFYGLDATPSGIAASAMSFPMNSERRVVMVKEAQMMKGLEKLEKYMDNPQLTTVLAIVYHGKPDLRKAKRILEKVEKCGGVVFESKRLYDNQLPTFIGNIFKQLRIEIEPNAVQMMADNIGNDLHKINNEIKKLQISLPKDTTKVTAEMVKKYVGNSRQYTPFELKDALLRKDALLVNKIVCFFEENPEKNPIQPVLALLFNTFANLMQYFYIPDKSSGNVASKLGINPYAVRDYETAAKFYNGWQTMRAIAEIRKADAASKGVNNVSTAPGQILKELVFHLLHDKK